MIRDWLELFRPVTLVPLLVIALAFGLMGLGHRPDAIEWARLLLAGGLLVVANGASNIVNQLADLRADAINERTRGRPIVSGRIDPQIALSVAVVAWIGCVVLGTVFLTPAFVALYGATLLFAWMYSFPPRLKRRFPANQLSLAAPRGALGIAAAWSVYGSVLDPRLWAVFAILVPFVALANSAKDIEDSAGDRADGVRNFATIWGERATRTATALGFAAPMTVIPLVWSTLSDPWLLLAYPLLAAGIAASFRVRGLRLWEYFYVSYAVLALLVGLPAILALL